MPKPIADIMNLGCFVLLDIFTRSFAHCRGWYMVQIKNFVCSLRPECSGVDC